VSAGGAASAAASGAPAVGSSSLDVVFAPVRSQTAFEETVDRLGTAIRLGLLGPGTRLPAERELCVRLGIARSTLRQALTALAQSGHLYSRRGRGGGTFVAAGLPPAGPPSAQLSADWRELCDERTALTAGVALLAAARGPAVPTAIARLAALVVAMDGELEDFAAYRRLDVRLHVGFAELTGRARLVSRETEIQGELGALLGLIAHPPEVLEIANVQHRRLVSAIARGDEAAAVREAAEHTRGTAHVIAGLQS
jgi:GntR family transcriptional repressor for pyruvate dehydrogenase complex